MDNNARIFVAGHRGLVGSAIARKLRENGFDNLLLRSSAELDLRRQDQVEAFFEQEKPEYVFLAAARVGGILANSTRPAEFLYDNLMIETNIIHAAYRTGAKKLLFLGSTCIYPKHAQQPIKEDSLLTGELEPTNEAYAIAKIAGIELCKFYNTQYGTDYIAVMPTNLYGPNDNFDLQSSHVLPALLRKFHEAKINGSAAVTVWGTGSPIREFLYVEDLADACLFLMQNYSENQIINIGTGQGIAIKELALLIREAVGYQGEIMFDTSKPDGTPVKIADISRLKSFGWSPRVSLREGLPMTYQWYLENART
ncbi:MAG TPA: GDP-L-fucose synthase [Selenomonadales bacterium]|nr:GDP-L-fucose synthase [Selenomonadales bacterium]